MSPGNSLNGVAPSSEAAFTAETSMPTIAESRKLLLDEVGVNPDLTLIRTEGNLGDQLIWAGTRRLLADRIYREIGLEEVASSHGEVAVIVGSGAWGRVYNQFMPELLAIAEMRFDRVIVFPSTFEVSEDRVRTALTGSRATFFAREVESYRQISGICRAGLALDGAFYYDYSSLRGVDASGELNAFRTDAERLGEIELPGDNQDISITANTLDDWLETIARHRTVNTDRAHVMIAAALLGRQVNYASSNYFKVDALAQPLLEQYDVHPYPVHANGRLDAAAIDALRAHKPQTASQQAASRVSVTITGRDNRAAVEQAITARSVAQDGVRVTVHDRNSLPPTRRLLESLSADHRELDFRFSDRDLGFPETLRRATLESQSEYLMVLDYDMHLSDGALERMIEVLDENSSVQAVAPVSVDSDAQVLHAGGWPAIGAGSVSIDLTAVDQPTAHLNGRSMATGWVPTAGTLFRRSVFDSFPLAAMGDGFVQSVDWCLRVAELGPEALQVCPQASVSAPRRPDQDTLPLFVSRRYAASELPAHAEFMELHGLVLSERLGQLVPELRDGKGELSVPAAQLLLSLAASRDAAWILMNWMNGGLEPLFAGAAAGSADALERERKQLEWLELRHERLVGIENGSWWRLRERMQPVRRVVLAARGLGRGDRGADR